MKNMQIEEYIPFGKHNAVTRQHLINVTGMQDSQIRAYIAGARRNGVPIINLQDGKGYYRPTVEDYAEAKMMYSQEYSRAMKILKGNKGLVCWIKDVERGAIK